MNDAERKKLEAELEGNKKLLVDHERCDKPVKECPNLVLGPSPISWGDGQHEKQQGQEDNTGASSALLGSSAGSLHPPLDYRNAVSRERITRQHQTHRGHRQWSSALS